jgi:hypothetical protein
MEHVEGGHSTDERKVPDTDNDGDVFIASGSLQPGRGAIVSGILSLSVGRTVTYNDSVTVYTPTDCSSGSTKGMGDASDQEKFVCS